MNTSSQFMKRGLGITLAVAGLVIGACSSTANRDQHLAAQFERAVEREGQGLWKAALAEYELLLEEIDKEPGSAQKAVLTAVVCRRLAQMEAATQPWGRLSPEERGRWPQIERKFREAKGPEDLVRTGFSLLVRQGASGTNASNGIVAAFCVERDLLCADIFQMPLLPQEHLLLETIDEQHRDVAGLYLQWALLEVSKLFSMHALKQAAETGISVGGSRDSLVRVLDRQRDLADQLGRRKGGTGPAKPASGSRGSASAPFDRQAKDIEKAAVTVSEAGIPSPVGWTDKTEYRRMDFDYHLAQGRAELSRALGALVGQKPEVAEQELLAALVHFACAKRIASLGAAGDSHAVDAHLERVLINLAE